MRIDERKGKGRGKEARKREGMAEFRLVGMKISEGKGIWEIKREGMVWLIVKKSSWEEEKENLGN